MKKMPKWFVRVATHYRRSGLRGVRLALWAKVLGKPLELLMRHPGIAHPLSVRLRSADLWTFDEVLVGREYDLPLPPKPRTIIDAGAHIGLASVYFANRFPDARIIALEPEPSNFDLLQRNTAPYPNIEPINAALWSTSGQLEVVDRGFGSWAFQTVPTARGGEKGLGTVRAMTLTQVLDDRSIVSADVLKIDVEGAEKEIFEHASDWIGRVQAVVAELHDRYVPGSSRSFYRATLDFPYYSQRGENVLVSRVDHGGMIR